MIYLWYGFYFPELALIDTRTIKINPVQKGKKLPKGNMNVAKRGKDEKIARAHTHTYIHTHT